MFQNFRPANINSYPSSMLTALFCPKGLSEAPQRQLRLLLKSQPNSHMSFKGLETFLGRCSRWQLLPRAALPGSAHVCPSVDKWQNISDWPGDGELPSPAMEAAELAKLGQRVLQGLGPPMKAGIRGLPPTSLWVPQTRTPNCEPWLSYHSGFEEGRVVIAWSGASDIPAARM